MKIITYNLNGIRAAMSKGLIDWISQVSPDVLCVQEIKANPDQVVGILFLGDLGILTMKTLRI